MASKKTPAPHAYTGLDRVLHEKARLSILTALLARPEGVLFPELKALCDLTDGNLARHLQTLHEASLIELWKNQDGRRPLYGDLDKFQYDPHWRDNVLFHEYFHGDTGAGLGASHQTGWTGLIATLLQEHSQLKTASPGRRSRKSQ